MSGTVPEVRQPARKGNELRRRVGLLRGDRRRRPVADGHKPGVPCGSLYLQVSLQRFDCEERVAIVRGAVRCSSC